MFQIISLNEMLKPIQLVCMYLYIFMRQYYNVVTTMLNRGIHLHMSTVVNVW